MWKNVWNANSCMIFLRLQASVQCPNARSEGRSYLPTQMLQVMTISDVFKSLVLVLSHKTSKSVFGVTDQEDQTLKNEVFCWMLLDPAKRQMSKPLTASGESLPRDNHTQTTLVRDKEQFLFFCFQEIMSLTSFDSCLMKYHKGCMSKMNNVFNAAYTHLKMYCYLEKLQNRVLYTDTKSLMYPVRDGEISWEVIAYKNLLPHVPNAMHTRQEAF